MDFKPYRVDLTPFADLLADGSPHTLTIGLYYAYSYFLLDATLLGFTDHGAQRERSAVSGRPGGADQRQAGGFAGYGHALNCERRYSITGHTGQSSQKYTVEDSLGYCYIRTLQSVNSVLTGYSDGKACEKR